MDRGGLVNAFKVAFQGLVVLVLTPETQTSLNTRKIISGVELNAQGPRRWRLRFFGMRLGQGHENQMY